MKIGNVKLKNQTVFAPLAGISNLPLRLMAKQAGCALVCSEMVSACGLVYGSAKTYALLDTTPAEKPLSVQLFGSDWAIMAEAAQRVQAAGADIVDINFGCSVRKILKSGSGAALMREPQKAQSLIKAVRNAIDVPLTIKMRSGWDASGVEAMLLADIAQACGVDAVTVHPRTARQGFGGHADWSLIEKIKQRIQIPVIGNGDITTADDALKMMDQTGCDAIMVGRAAIGNLFVFSQIADRLAGREPAAIVNQMRIEMMSRYLEASVRYLGEKRACYMMRGRLGWFVKGLDNASRFRKAIRHIDSEAQAKKLIADYGAELSAGQGNHK
jgi:nifR3 family TIM-barrel protein